ncbi:response regulator [Leptolyngbya iicbica]|uniref:Response regulator n=2 Tax=Cyanophyceae TaxID=3028117 RepID=A0A4Q7EFY1_9CYAN|nr:response regulator [Leptolyngbya sp. LK]RZM82205.1 response regulator [Leptolyngbya sp. LK]
METHNIGLDNSVVTQRPQSLPVIVAVDDDEDSLVLLSYVVEGLPCSLVCETDGQAGLERIISLKPDLVLLDVRLPGISGFDIVHQLKSSPDTASIPLIAVTALAGQRYQQALRAAGFNHYICKPYGLNDIQAAIQQYLFVATQL